ncbi:hypothetical protein YC2023_075533 [Brassica napus]
MPFKITGLGKGIKFMQAAKKLTLRVKEAFFRLEHGISSDKPLEFCQMNTKTNDFRLILRCTEASSDVRFPLRNRNRNRNLVEACGISLPKRF